EAVPYTSRECARAPGAEIARGRVDVLDRSSSRRTDQDAAAGTVDRAVDGIGGGDRLAARGLERDGARERMGAGVSNLEGIVCGQDGETVTAAEVHRAEVAGRRVVVGVLCGNDDIEGGAGGRTGRAGYAKGHRGRRGHYDGAARPGDG